MQCQKHRDPGAWSQILRAAGAACCVVVLAGCPGPAALRPPAESAPVQRAERLARAGDHGGAARAFEEAAAAVEGEARALALVKAEREWLLVPSVADAARVDTTLAALPGIEPKSPTGVARAVASAEVALAAGQAERALAALRALGEPPPGAEAEVLLARAKAQFGLGRAFDGVRALTARERYLTPTQLADNRHDLWELLRAAAARGANLSYPRGTDALSAGWLELARVATQLRRPG